MKPLPLLAVIGCLLAADVARAQPAPAPDAGVAPGTLDVTALSLEDLLNTPVSVASQQVRPLREVPGIVTVVTRDEIVNSGARDLIDVLRMVPGFEFDGDVDDEVNVGFRGVYAASGKILLMIDGIDVSEHLFQSLYFGNHYPIENVDHIEIIRGGGSVVYGGAAEIAVINLVSRNGASLSGVSASGIYAQQANGLDRRNLTLSGGQGFSNGLDVAASVFMGQGHRSDRQYNDFYGNSAMFAQGDTTTLNPFFLNVGASYKDLKARVLYESFVAHEVDASGLNLLDANGANVPAPQQFTSFSADLQYDAKIGDRLTITPRVTYWNQTPWQVSDQTSAAYYEKSCNRWDAKITASYLAMEGLHLNGGAEAYTEHAWVIHPELAGTGYQTLFGGRYGNEPAVSNRDIAAFAEVAWDSPWVNALAGARYEYHSAVGTSLVPRFALTKVLGKLHGKLLYSQSFRAPAFEEISLSDTTVPLHPERTSLAEAEVGYALTDNVFGRVNVFNMIITDTLLYVADPVTQVQTYRNYNQTGTRGVEAEIRLKSSLGDTTLTYSFYTAAGINQAEQFQVPGQVSPLLAYPQHKVTWNASINLPRGFTLNPTVMFYSGRWGYLDQDGTNSGVGVLAQTPGGALVNLFLNYRPPLVKGLLVGVGVYNLLDDPYAFIQAYNAGHAPLPAPSRDFVARASYTFGL